MNLVKKIGCLIILLSFVAQKTYTMETPDNNPGWLSSATLTFLNGYLGFKQLLSSVTNPSTGFSDLPIEVQTTIIQLFAKSCTDKTLKESAQTINALAQTNKHLNTLINDPEFNLQLIKNRAQQFNVSDIKVAKELQTQASKTQLKIQLALAKIMKELIEEQENNNALAKLNRLLKGFTIEDKLYKVDLDFTYRWDQESDEYYSPLMYAIENENKFLIQYLLKNGASPIITNDDDEDAAQATEDQEIIDFMQ